MKLIIQIPCYNEEETISKTLSDLPEKIEGIDEIQVLIINDGSTDKTIEAAKASGVENFIDFQTNRGLARAFSAGLAKSLDLGADIIVNTDADNQYCADDIQKLIKPILEKKADIVIGTRPVEEIKHFSFTKKMLQKLGSWVMRVISSTDIQDAPSGFRAFSKDAALKINIFDNYTYTLETIIQARAKGLKIACVPVRVNPELRKSKLMKNMFDYIRRSSFTMMRMFIVYRPFRFFAIIGSIFLLAGFFIGARFLYFYSHAQGSGHIQSLILSAILILTGVQTGLIAVFAELQSINRKIVEDIQTRVKKIELNK
ncbi:MAG TPA: glycosyltransferase family 2 protein [Candidatus Gastranaerophilaceae bacterium]|nr:glycosyltransferase family 2 protein [Candidatus Gastranaerophilaceae bacterium]